MHSLKVERSLESGLSTTPTNLVWKKRTAALNKKTIKNHKFISLLAPPPPHPTPSPNCLSSLSMVRRVFAYVSWGGEVEPILATTAIREGLLYLLLFTSLPLWFLVK
jgi:hypothetical protein